MQGTFNEIDIRSILQLIDLGQQICIEDDIAIGKAVEYILQKHGYQVTVIKNPRG